MAEEARTSSMAPLRAEVLACHALSGLPAHGQGPALALLAHGHGVAWCMPHYQAYQGSLSACTSRQQARRIMLHFLAPAHAWAVGRCIWSCLLANGFRRQCLQVARLRESARDLQTQLSKDTADLRAAASQRENAARAEAQGVIEQLQATAAQLQVS